MIVIYIYGLILVEIIIGKAILYFLSYNMLKGPLINQISIKTKKSRSNFCDK